MNFRGLKYCMLVYVFVYNLENRKRLFHLQCIYKKYYFGLVYFGSHRQPKLTVVEKVEENSEDSGYCVTNPGLYATKQRVT